MPLGFKKLFRVGLGCLVLGSFGVVACGSSSSDEASLPASDFLTPKNAKFNPNAIVEPDFFADVTTFNESAIQLFLERTPYQRASFLATYQSNGVRAAAAIQRAAVAYQINPLVFIVRAQAMQGLISESAYPFPASRVEYVYRCGCNGDTCTAESSGFDKQVDCFGRRLRQSMDAIATRGITTQNWGPGKSSTTEDNEKITPANSPTAALYQEDPVVGKGKSNLWLFWNIKQNYSAYLKYDSHQGGASGGRKAAWIGDACTNDSVCTATGSFCDLESPGGQCTVPCKDQCPSDPGHPASFCTEFTSAEGYCLPKCKPSTPNTCRGGYECRTVYKRGDRKVTEDVCVPSRR